MDSTTLIKDSKITHLSTWMLITDDAMAARLTPLAGDQAIPIEIRVNLFATELNLKVYKSKTVADFIAELAAIADMQPS